VPLLVEVVFPEGTLIGVGKMKALAIKAFERVRTRFTLLGFEPR